MVSSESRAGRASRGREVLRAAFRIAPAVALALVAGVAGASDPPHWFGASVQIDCTSQCHVSHHSTNLSQSESNVNLCQSCHVDSGLAGDQAVASADMAVPGTGGIHHAFDVCSVNAGLDAQIPNDAEQALRLMGADGSCPEGYLVCSTCHDQHAAEAATGGSSRISLSREVTKDGGSTGSVSSGGAFTGVRGVWYLIEMVAAGSETTSRFRYSKDNGTSWIPTGCSSGNLGPCKTADGSTPVALDDLVNEGVEVTFNTGSYTVGDAWEFSATWPFLRRVLPLNQAPDALVDSGDNTTGDSFCRDCHRSWVMTDSDVETWDDTFKSHPIGVALDTNGRGYDRSIPLDGNGAEQGSGGADLNASNDLRFDNSGFVQCLSCHGVHYADGNTQTVDGP